MKNLQVKWLFQGRHQEKFETTPLVVDGIMYLTRPENDVFALDAETGRVMWTYSHKNPERTYNCCGKVNRGLAILGNRLFMNTLDMHVIAIDARSGREMWKTEMYDYTASGGYAATGAPLVGEGQSDRRHGRRRAFHFRFSRCLRRCDRASSSGGSTPFRSRASRTSAPGPATPGRPAASLPGTTAPTIPKPTPCTGAPAIRGRITTGISARATTLYSCSVLALDPDTGKLKWHYQFTPHDTHDWDATQIPILLELRFAAGRGS